MIQFSEDYSTYNTGEKIAANIFMYGLIAIVVIPFSYALYVPLSEFIPAFIDWIPKFITYCTP